MKIRAFTPDDMKEFERIHAKHFANEFYLPKFMEYVCAFVVEDECGVVTYGGIRDIAECVTVTNKDRSVRDRADALYGVLDAAKFIAKANQYDQIYAWSQNPLWARRLLKTGFKRPVGESLILDL